jgi:hypothetical protein
MVTAPGAFVPTMMTGLQPEAEEVMTYLWNTSPSFRQMVAHLDAAAEMDGHAESPSLAVMATKVSDYVFEAIELLDPLALD